MFLGYAQIYLCILSLQFRENVQSERLENPEQFPLVLGSMLLLWVYKLELIYNSCIEVPFSISFSFGSSKEQFFFTVVASKQSGLDHFSHVIKLGAGATLGMYLEFMVEQPKNCHIAAYLHALLTKSL